VEYSTIYRGNHTGSSASPPSLLESALALAAEGWPVFPCRADKKPIFKGGFKLASTDPTVIRQAFTHPPAQLIGVPTGPASGVDVLDLDPRHGSDAWKAANSHLLPETRVHMTMNGGEHWLFRHAPGIRNDQSGRIGVGVDVRGEGGYAIFPSSAGYRVISDAEIAEWPPELLALARKPPKAATSERSTAKPKQQPDQLKEKRYQGFVGKLLDKSAANHGFDAQSGTYVDMLKAGIIDPAKVVRLALQGAASVAGLLITTEAMIADKPQGDTSTMPGGGMDGSGF